MANYYNDNKALKFYLNHPEMKAIVDLKERNYTDKIGRASCRESV